MVRKTLISKAQGAKSSKQITRSIPVIDEKGKLDYRFKRVESKNKYGVLRSQPRIVEIIKKALA